MFVVLAVSGAVTSSASANISCAKLGGTVVGSEGFLSLRGCTPVSEGFKRMVTGFQLEGKLGESWVWPRTAVNGALVVETHDEGIALSCARTRREALVMVVTVIVDQASGPGVPVVGETATNEVCLNPTTSRVALPKGHQFTL